MKIVQDFFNKTAQEVMKTYFPSVKFYRDDENAVKAKYAIELFNNGCLEYTALIARISTATGAEREDIHKLVSKHIEDFEGFEYDPFEETTYEIIGYMTSSDFDGRNGTDCGDGYLTMEDALKFAEELLDEYVIVKVQSSDREEIKLLGEVPSDCYDG